MLEGAGGATPRPEILRLFAAIAEVRARPMDGLTNQQVAEELVLMRQADDHFQLACAETVRVYDKSYGHEEDTHPVAFLRYECRDSTHMAVDLALVADHLETLPASVRALEAGRIGFDHLALLARSQARITPRGEWSQELEARLLRKAADQTVTQFRRTCLHAQHAADAEGFLRDQ